MWTYSCDSIGMGGNCGDGCPVFADGNCEIWAEIPNRDLDPDEYQEHIEEYKRVAEEERIHKEKVIQVKGGNMKVPFRIDEEFIAKLLISYYKGDNSLKNPMRMFIENEAFSDNIINMVYDKINKQEQQNLFYMDLLLNHRGEYLDFKKDIHYTIKNILNNDFRGIGQSMINAMRTNFFEADLELDDFLTFDMDLDILLEQNTPAKYYKANHAMAQHKNFGYTLKMELYDTTQDLSFLPEDAQEMFLF